MSQQQQPQPLAPTAVEQPRASDSSNRAPQFRSRELRTTAELVEPYRFVNVRAARNWVRRHELPIYKRGRRLLVDLRDVDAALRRRI